MEGIEEIIPHADNKNIAELSRAFSQQSVSCILARFFPKCSGEVWASSLSLAFSSPGKGNNTVYITDFHLCWERDEISGLFHSPLSFWFPKKQMIVSSLFSKSISQDTNVVWHRMWCLHWSGKKERNKQLPELSACIGPRPLAAASEGPTPASQMEIRPQFKGCHLEDQRQPNTTQLLSGSEIFSRRGHTASL